MSDTSKIALGVASGYLLGRTKKLKLAISVGSMLAGKKIATDPKGLLEQAAKLIENNEELSKLSDQVRGQLFDAARAAVVATAANRMNGLSDSIRDRSQRLSLVSGGSSEEEPEDEYDEEEPEDEYDEGDEAEGEEEQPEDEAAGDEGEEPEDEAAGAEEEEPEEEPVPRKRSAAKNSSADARKAPAKKSAPAKKTAAATKAPAKKASATRSTTKKSASTASKSTAKKSAPAKKTAAKKSTPAKKTTSGTRKRASSRSGSPRKA